MKKNIALLLLLSSFGSIMPMMQQGAYEGFMEEEAEAALHEEEAKRKEQEEQERKAKERKAQEEKERKALATFEGMPEVLHSLMQEYTGEMFVPSTVVSLEAPVFCVSFNSDGKKIAVGDREGNIHIVDAITKKLEFVFKVPTSVKNVFFGPIDLRRDESIIVVTHHGNMFYMPLEERLLYDLTHGNQNNNFRPPLPYYVRDATINHSETLMALSTTNHGILLVDAENFTLRQTLPYEVQSMQFSHDGSKIMGVAQARSSIRIFDVKSGLEPSRPIQYLGYGLIDSAELSPNKEDVLIVFFDGRVAVNNMATGRYKYDQLAATMNLAHYNNDGTLIVTVPKENANHICIFRASDGQLLQTLEGHIGPVDLVSFSPDGKKMVSASRDGTVRVWEKSLLVSPIVAQPKKQEEKTAAQRQQALVNSQEQHGLLQQFKKIRARDNLAQLIPKKVIQEIEAYIRSLDPAEHVTREKAKNLQQRVNELEDLIQQAAGLMQGLQDIQKLHDRYLTLKQKKQIIKYQQSFTQEIITQEKEKELNAFMTSIEERVDLVKVILKDVQLPDNPKTREDIMLEIDKILKRGEKLAADKRLSNEKIREVIIKKFDL